VTDIALPSGLCPARVTWTLERNRALEESPYSRVAQTQGRPGDRWRATVSWPVLYGDDPYVLATWLDQVSKVGNHALVPVAQNDMTGTESGSTAFADLVKPWRENQFTGWVGQNLLTPPYLDGPQVVVFGNQNPPAYIAKGFSVTPLASYVLMFDVPVLGGPFRVTVFDGQGILFDVGGPGGSTAYGRQLARVFPRDSSLTIFLYSSNDSAAFKKAIYGDIVLYRSYSQQSSVAAGSSLFQVQGGINQAPNSGFRSGQFVVIPTTQGNELKRLRNSVQMVSGGSLNGLVNSHVGDTYIEPPLRGSVANQAAIYHHKPWCRMRLATAVSSADITPPLLHGFSVDFVEEL